LKVDISFSTQGLELKIGNNIFAIIPMHNVAYFRNL